MLEEFRGMRRIDLLLIHIVLQLGGPYNDALHAMYRISGNIQTSIRIMMHGVHLGTPLQVKRYILREYIQTEVYIIQAFHAIPSHQVDPAVYEQTRLELVDMVTYIINVLDSD